MEANNPPALEWQSQTQGLTCRGSAQLQSGSPSWGLFLLSSILFLFSSGATVMTGSSTAQRFTSQMGNHRKSQSYESLSSISKSSWQEFKAIKFNSSRWLTDCCVVVAKTGEQRKCQKKWRKWKRGEGGCSTTLHCCAIPLLTGMSLAEGPNYGGEGGKGYWDEWGG